MSTATSFLKNTWYVAAWSHEIAADTMLARTLIRVPLLFWRGGGGKVVALDDRCCHRAAPLSKGRREGDNIRCMYHGLLFDKTGKCVEIPSQDFIPPAAKVRSYPVVERFKWIWIWMGDADQADPSLIPDTHTLDDAGWRGTPGYLHYAANYLLITDNLLDFSHLSYVHETTLGGSAKYAGIRPKVTRNGRSVRVERWLIDDEPAPFLRNLKTWTGNVDRWNIYDVVLPGVLLMDSGSAPTGTGAPRRAPGWMRRNSLVARRSRRKPKPHRTISSNSRTGLRSTTGRSPRTCGRACSQDFRRIWTSSSRSSEFSNSLRTRPCWRCAWTPPSRASAP